MPNYNVRFDIADVRYIAFEKFCKKHNIEFSIQPLLQQCNVSGALPPVDNRLMFADYIQRCVIERGQMTYPSLQDAIKAWDETTERFGGNEG